MTWPHLYVLDFPGNREEEAIQLTSIPPFHEIESPLTEKILSKKEEKEMITISDSQKTIIWSVGLFLYPSLVIILLSAYMLIRKRKK